MSSRTLQAYPPAARRERLQASLRLGSDLLGHRRPAPALGARDPDRLPCVYHGMDSRRGPAPHRRTTDRPVPSSRRSALPWGCAASSSVFRTKRKERVAFLEEAPPPEPIPPRTPLSRRGSPAYQRSSLLNRPDVRRASIPAGAGGIMSARDLARTYASLATGVDGVRLLPPERPAWRSSRGNRPCPGPGSTKNIRKGLGYFLPGENAESISDSPDSFGHPGVGGSVGYADPFHKLAVGFAKTRLTIPVDLGTNADVRVTARIRQVLGIGARSLTARPRSPILHPIPLQGAPDAEHGAPGPDRRDLPRVHAARARSRGRRPLSLHGAVPHAGACTGPCTRTRSRPW